jgi:chromosome segregation protein
MRLKHLELQGYKTFASRTEFAFNGGITAIVGPNGSGKSNIADAIRWVLGEQSYRALRAKRTEDMIFSGSAQRARLGMASASLVLDNSESWLPIDFTEVTIARRAYRSGENEYMVNGQRVRLRDIVELLSSSGLAHRTYTVVGQGLVDAVLSLRPEDRRELFEEAAGITLYRSKRADALTRLDETRSNLLRVNDIVNEIAPRLSRLERQAERAEHYILLSQQLDGLLRTWYGYRWRREQQALRRTRDGLKRRAESLERRREALDGLNEQMAALRARQYEVREQLGRWHRESSDLHRQMEEVQRDLAVWQERARLLALQRDQLQADLAEQEAQAQGVAERIVAAEKEVAESQDFVQAKEALVTEAQVDLEDHESQRGAISQQIARVQSRILDLAGRATDCQNRLAQLDERRAARADEQEEHEHAISSQQVRAGELVVQIETGSAEQARVRERVEALDGESVRLEAALAETQARQTELRAALSNAQGGLQRLRGRYELLVRLREEGEGLRTGVRSVLQAAARANRASATRGQGRAVPGGLSGIIGSVAQLIYVPEEYEAAIEVALGGHLQDVVVESWSDAEAAIGFLQSERRGRATLLPLDTVRPLPRLEMLASQGVIGVGADLVRAESRLSRVVEMLLGRTIVVRDLKAARRSFDQLRGGFQIVTLAGELLRSSGSVSGGQGRDQAQGQVLAREREWRQLPSQLETAEARVRELDTALADAQSHGEQAREQLSGIQSQRRRSERAFVDARSKILELQGEADQLGQQIAWRQGLLAQLEVKRRELDELEFSLRSDRDRFTGEEEAAKKEMADLQAGLDRLRGEALYQRLSEARTVLAVARGTWEHRQAALNALRERQSQVESQIEAKRERLVALEEERASLVEQIAGQASREAAVQGWLGGLAQRIEPAEAEIARLEADRQGLEEGEATLRARLRQAESSHAQAVLAQSRQEDRLGRLRQQIVDDFGLVDMEPTQGLPEQPPLPLGELVSSLPAVETLPEGLEAEIHQLKAQMRRMGSVNPGAPEEYAETLDRYTFLTEQAADLEEAAGSLRKVISELDEVMQSEFQATFKAVAERFRQNFTQLFGGGAARLVLTEADDVSCTGVEIVARPPGKRQQTLALLSGGERSLTAVALIFALLQVSPPPFCILDEVDAMLDEANVGRFREALKALTRHTQFIVITHNRGTIQAADTIYGISMGEDSISQAVSLRLDGDHIATVDGSPTEERTL